jgi:hypothetical protein
MAGSQKSLPKSDTWTVANVFSYSPERLYRVPSFQRGYAWTDDQVGKLLTDLWEAFSDVPDDYYLLGQIILTSSEDSPWLDVIDGQQRLTTLFMILALARQRIGEGENLSAAKNDKLHLINNYLSFHDQKTDSLASRFVPAVSIRQHMTNMLNGDPLPESKNLSHENFEQAFEDIKSYLADIEPSQTFDFIWFIVGKAVMLSLTLESKNQAIQVFARINNRGLTLDDADLLKNLLFEKVGNEDDFQRLSDAWEKANGNLYESKLKRVKSMEFLMKALIGIETGVSVRSDDVFEEWEKRLTTEKLAKDFAMELPDKAKYLANISNGLTPSSIATEITAGSKHFKWVQHLQVLLAGSHLSEDTYADLAKVVEARVMLSLFSSEKNQEFERLIHPWSQQISKLDPYASREEVLKASSPALNIESLKARIGDLEKQLSLLSYTKKTHRDKIRYVIARCAMAVQFGYANDHASSANSVVSFMKTTSGKGSHHIPGYDLDHIFPATSIAEDRAKWDSPGEQDLINSLGNLALLHPSDNKSQSAAMPWEEGKIHNYAGSGLIINRLLADKKELGSLSQKTESVVDLLQEKYPMSLIEWGAEQVRKHNHFYFELFANAILSDLGYLTVDELNSAEGSQD